MASEEIYRYLADIKNDNRNIAKLKWADMENVKSFKFGSGICLIFLAICVAACLLPNQAFAANFATAGQDDGYSGRILDKIIQKWQPPNIKKPNYRLNAVLAVESDGSLADCRVQKSSGLKGIDESVCDAAKAASPFGTPPYGMPASIYFSLWSGNDPAALKKAAGAQQATSGAGSASGGNTAAKKAGNKTEQNQKSLTATQNADDATLSSYISRARRDLRNSIYIPKETKPGTYHAVAQIRCDSQGKILAAELIEKTGDERLDKYVMQGIRRAGKVAPPPPALGDTFKIDFRLVRNKKGAPK